MIWLILALAGAFFVALHYAVVKKLLKGVNQYTLGAGVFMVSFILYLVISIAIGLPEIGTAFYYSIILAGLLDFAAAALYYKALRITDLYLAVPMTAFTPVLLIVTSFALLNEVPTPIGMIGIFLVVFGYVILSLKRSITGKARLGFSFDRGMLYMFVVAVIYSLTNPLFKIAIQNSDTIISLAVACLFTGVPFFIVAFFSDNEMKATLHKNMAKLFLAAVLMVITDVLIMTAITMNLVSYTVAVKRMSILFSVVLGGLMFREKGLMKRAVGALLMVLGVVLIALS